MIPTPWPSTGSIMAHTYYIQELPRAVITRRPYAGQSKMPSPMQYPQYTPTYAFGYGLKISRRGYSRFPPTEILT